MLRTGCVIGLALMVCVPLPQREACGQLPVIEVSDNGRFLQTAGGSPFFWLGDTAWRLFRLNPTELDQYFANRAAKGFTVIQGPVLHVPNQYPNYAGHANPNPAAPNAAWFNHIDLIVTKAAEHGLYLAPVLSWGDMVDDFTLSSAYNFGFYVGNRYRGRSNIAAYLIAGEFNHPEPNTAIWNQMALGLLAGLADQPRLISAHPRWYGVFGGQTTSEDLHGFDWLSFNLIQSSLYGDCTNDPANLYYLGTHNWKLVQNDYALLPVKPVIDGEATYERQSPGHALCSFNPERWDDYGVRRRAYWSVFAGGFGHTYGANGVFQFHKVDDPATEWNPEDYWHVAMDYAGGSQMIHLRRLIESRPFFSRIAGQDFIMAPLDELVPTHMHATRDSAGRFAMVYVPGNNRPVTVDMDLVSGQDHRAWWYNPRNGAATLIGEFDDDDYAANGAFTLVTPSQSGAGSPDWVLVIDDASQGFSAPGTAAERCDVTGDGMFAVDDLLAVVNSWGPCLNCAADLAPPGGNNIVNVDDLLVVLVRWGPCS